MIIVVRHVLEAGLQVLNVTMLVFEGGLQICTHAILIVQNRHEVCYILIQLSGHFFALLPDPPV